MRRSLFIASFFASALLLLGLQGIPESAVAQVAPTPVTQAEYTGRSFERATNLGITFISSAQIEQNDERYQNALLLGAGWTRWPLYWNQVQPSADTWDWEAYDELVINDVRYGLSINAILLDRPPFYADGDSIAGLREPIFADGSDSPGVGKAINPNNPWAQFVYAAVQRYKPGGDLAQEQGWTEGQGIEVWEAWNEPDLEQFWRGGIPNYARLLKVAYLAAHHADPETTVMFGGLLYNTPENWLARVLAIYVNDPLASRNNYFFDAVGIHAYSYPWRTGWLTLFARQTLIAYDLDKPIFVNETGLSAWNDYPGPTWASAPEQRIRLGTTDQQAWYFIQSTTYAFLEGADVVFYHQLYDDCGDQAAGTNFPPNNGELCASGAPCFGDAFGMFRNTSDSICFSQHPNPGTARPVAAAFQLMAQVFGTISFTEEEMTRDETGYTVTSFLRESTNERIRVIWNRQFEPMTASILAESNRATFYTLNGVTTITPNGENYLIPLRAAEPDSFPELEFGDISAVAGEPVIIIEALEGDSAPPVDATSAVDVAGNSSSIVPATPTLGPVINPTINPDLDTESPVTYVDALPATSPQTFTVSWGATDDGTIFSYVVWVQVNDGEWTPWLETQRDEGIYTGESGNTYRFAVWAVDTGGNWSQNIALEAQAETVVE
ncbi:MAG: fibronectin type III domain-containing protein [Chloroflexota bacterium]